MSRGAWVILGGVPPPPGPLSSFPNSLCHDNNNIPRTSALAAGASHSTTTQKKNNKPSMLSTANTWFMAKKLEKAARHTSKDTSTGIMLSDQVKSKKHSESEHTLNQNHRTRRSKKPSTTAKKTETSPNAAKYASAQTTSGQTSYNSQNKERWKTSKTTTLTYTSFTSKSSSRSWLPTWKLSRTIQRTILNGGSDQPEPAKAEPCGRDSVTTATSRE